jgi:hypothetical protein
MKIIEAMKRVKMNKEKVADLRKRIGQASANLSIETPLYENAAEKVKEWLQSCADLSQDNVALLVAIQRTNLATNVTIELGGKQVTKSIAEWVWRRREYAKTDMDTWAHLTDRNLKEQRVAQSTGAEPLEIKLIRNYDPTERDDKLALYRSEPHIIDSALEIVNATTDLVE